MPVETTLSRAQYNTNGTTGPWSVPFYFLADADLRVVYADADGVETDLTLDTDYTVTGAGVADGGAVTTTTAYASGGTITILRDVDALQPIEFQDGDPFPADSANRGLDRLTMLSQQLIESTGRALRFPISGGPIAELPGRAADFSGYYLGIVGGQPGYLLAPEGTAGALAGDLAGTASGKGAALMGFSHANTYAQGTAGLALQAFINVKNEPFNAVGDGVADDTAAIEAALAYLAVAGGGALFFPSGTYKTTAQITIPGNKITLLGTGKRGVYPGLFAPSATGPSTIMPAHTGRNAFRFYSTGANGDGTFLARGINVATLETGSVPTAAFGFDCAGVFMRDFSFEHCGIYGFTSPFDVYKASGAITEMGLLKVRNCNINRNTWIARTLNGCQWNGFLFHDNEAGQNGFLEGQGGIAIAAHACTIENNCLEGMRDPVKVTGTYRGVSVRGNYFEANVGRACVELMSVRGPYQVGPNTYLAVVDADLAQKVFLTDCGLGLCLDPYWPNVVYKAALPLLGADDASADNVLNNTLSSTTYGFCRVDTLEGSNFSRPPQFKAIAYQRVTSNARELNPQTGDPMPTQEYTTSGSGAVALSYTISGDSGDWVVCSWLMKQQPGSATANAYVSLNVNGTGAAGSKDYPLEAFTTNVRAGDWVLITAAIKLGVAMTSFGVTLFPHGTAPAAGLVSRFLRPVVYTVDNVNKIVPFIDNYTAQSAGSSPGGGSWLQGDWIHNSGVTTAGQSRYVCTVAGTPGTWVFG